MGIYALSKRLLIRGYEHYETKQEGYFKMQIVLSILVTNFPRMDKSAYLFNQKLFLLV